MDPPWLTICKTLHVDGDVSRKDQADFNDMNSMISLCERAALGRARILNTSGSPNLLCQSALRLASSRSGLRLASSAAAAPPPARLVVLFDGSCGLCRREIAALRRLPAGADPVRTQYIDASARGFDPAARSWPWGARASPAPTQEQLLSEMHVFADGEFHRRVAAFRTLYVHLGVPSWLLAWTAVAPFDAALDRAYAAFLKHVRPRVAALLPP